MINHRSPIPILCINLTLLRYPAEITSIQGSALILVLKSVHIMLWNLTWRKLRTLLSIFLSLDVFMDLNEIPHQLLTMFNPTYNSTYQLNLNLLKLQQKGPTSSDFLRLQKIKFVTFFTELFMVQKRSRSLCWKGINDYILKETRKRWENNNYTKLLRHF